MSQLAFIYYHTGKGGGEREREGGREKGRGRERVKKRERFDFKGFIFLHLFKTNRN